MVYDLRILKFYFNYFLVDFLIYCMILKYENI